MSEELNINWEEELNEALHSIPAITAEAGYSFKMWQALIEKVTEHDEIFAADQRQRVKDMMDIQARVVPPADDVALGLHLADRTVTYDRAHSSKELEEGGEEHHYSEAVKRQIDVLSFMWAAGYVYGVTEREVSGFMPQARISAHKDPDPTEETPEGFVDEFGTNEIAFSGHRVKAIFGDKLYEALFVKPAAEQREKDEGAIGD